MSERFHLKRSGDYSCQNTAESSATKYLGQEIPVIPGKKYNLSFLYKTIIINDEHGCRIWCHWEDSGNNSIDDPAWFCRICSTIH